MANRDLRRNVRIAHLGTLKLSWVDRDGKPKSAKGQCTDLSGDGLRVELPVDIPARTLVLVEFPSIHLTGTASVRYARHRGMKFDVGCEFNQQLKNQVSCNTEAQQLLSTTVPS